MNTDAMSIDALRRAAISAQHMAADDARLAFPDGRHELDNEYRAKWQEFSAQASAAARKYLFALIDREAAK